MDCKVHKVAKSWTQLSNFHLHFPYGLKQRIAGQLREEAGHSPDHVFFHSQSQETSSNTHTQKSSMEVKGEWC